MKDGRKEGAACRGAGQGRAGQGGRGKDRAGQGGRGKDRAGQGKKSRGSACHGEGRRDIQVQGTQRSCICRHQGVGIARHGSSAAVHCHSRNGKRRSCAIGLVEWVEVMGV